MDISKVRPGVLAPQPTDSGYAVAVVAALPWQGEAVSSPSDIQRYPLKIEDGIHAQIQIAPLGKRDREHALKELALVIPENEAQALLEHEGQVLAWLEKEQNRARFVTDPLGSLREIGVKFRHDTWKKLSAARAARLRVFDASALNQIRSLKIQLRSDGTRDERG